MQRPRHVFERRKKSLSPYNLDAGRSGSFFDNHTSTSTTTIRNIPGHDQHAKSSGRPQRTFSQRSETEPTKDQARSERDREEPSACGVDWAPQKEHTSPKLFLVFGCEKNETLVRSPSRPTIALSSHFLRFCCVCRPSPTTQQKSKPIQRNATNLALF